MMVYVMKKLLFLGLILAFNVSAADIFLTWDKPELREDGSQIETIDRFNIYYTVDNVLQSPIEVPADALNFQLSEVQAGNHTFQISTVEGGQEGELSYPVSVNVSDSKPVRIELTVRVIE